MILSFRHKGLELFYRTGSLRGIQAAHRRRLSMILSMLDVAAEPTQLDVPGLRLHAPKGKLQEYWSVAVSGNWRVTFRFVGADIELVDYVDYH